MYKGKEWVYIIDADDKKVLDIVEYKHISRAMRAWRSFKPGTKIECDWKENMGKYL